VQTLWANVLTLLLGRTRNVAKIGELPASKPVNSGVYSGLMSAALANAEMRDVAQVINHLKLGEISADEMKCGK